MMATGCSLGRAARAWTSGLAVKRGQIALVQASAADYRNSENEQFAWSLSWSESRTMYTKRIQLVNYGPIEKLDIDLPFQGDVPKPLVFVGENGSGKSILLSHIMNGLITAKGIAFATTPEIESGKAYKLRSASYIGSGKQYYFGRVDFEDTFFVSELRSMQNKEAYPNPPAGVVGTPAEVLWQKMAQGKSDQYDSNLSSPNPAIKDKIDEVFAKNCVLYFPFNRSEEPAWLNERNLKAQAQYMDLRHIAGDTSRRIIASSPLHENQDWLFDVYL